MKQDEFVGNLDEQIRNVASRIELGHESKVEIVFPHIRCSAYDTSRAIVQVPTKGPTTMASLKTVNNSIDFILEKARINRELDAKWMKSPEGIQAANNEADRRIWNGRRNAVIKLAEQTGRLVDEHGGISGRGDHNEIVVHDIVDDPIELKRLHAIGKRLAVVAQRRVRVYAGHQWGPSAREDFFLVGENENGIPFAHAISNTVYKTVSGALEWIWEVDTIGDVIDRHGDVAVVRCKKQFKSSGQIGKIAVLDNHVFEGEYRKNGAIYVRNGILHHTKEQHPDVKIGNEWVKLKAGRRSERRMNTGSRD